MLKVFAIARNAFLEAIRQPIFFVLILVTAAILVLDVPMAAYTMGTGNADFTQTDQQWLIVMGLSTLLMSGLLVAAFSAAGVISREIEDRTILTVLAKPVSRPTVVLGKYLGVSSALVLSLYVSTLIFFLTVRHRVMPTAADPVDWPVVVIGCSSFFLALLAALFLNYFFGWNWISSTVSLLAGLLTVGMLLVSLLGKGWTPVSILQTFTQDIPPEVVISVVLVLLCVLVFAAVAVAASTRLGQVSTILSCLAFFVVGSLAQNFFGTHPEQPVMNLAYRTFPNLNFFFTLDVLEREGGTVPASYLGLAGLYALLQIVAILAVGMALFQGRDLERGSETSLAPRLVGLLAWCGRAQSILLAMAALVPPAGWNWKFRVLYALGMAVLAAGFWLFWGWFGRGVKWTYWVFMIIVVLAAGALGVQLARGLPPARLAGPAGLAALGAAVLVTAMMLLPRNRFHFGLAGKQVAAGRLSTLTGALNADQ